MKQDLEHLRLLSIFHYVVAGLTALFSLIPVIHLLVGLGMVFGQFEGSDPGIETMGLFFSCFAGTFILIGLSFAACIVLAGRYLTQKTHYTFCLVIAGCLCIMMPFGTVLGVFTIIVLMRESVKEMFEGSGNAVEEVVESE